MEAQTLLFVVIALALEQWPWGGWVNGFRINCLYACASTCCWSHIILSARKHFVNCDSPAFLFRMNLFSQWRCLIADNFRTQTENGSLNVCKHLRRRSGPEFYTHKEHMGMSVSIQGLELRVLTHQITEGFRPMLGLSESICGPSCCAGFLTAKWARRAAEVVVREIPLRGVPLSLM